MQRSPLSFGLRYAIVTVGAVTLGLLGAHQATAQSLDPSIYVLVDTSGSMLLTVDGTQKTYGDGSSEHPHYAGRTSRFYMAKQALSTVINGYGEVRWGLARFEQRSGLNYFCSCSSEIPNNLTGCGGYGGLWDAADACNLCDLMQDAPDHDLPGTHDRVCINYAGGVLNGCLDPISNAALTGADILVTLGSSNHATILKWIDGAESDPGEAGYLNGQLPGAQPDPELRATGGTPIAGSLQDLYAQLSTSDIGADPLRGCRPYSIIVLTDGAESCGGDPAAAAAALRSTPDLTRTCGTGCPPNSTCVGGRCRYDVKTYVIAFAVAPNEYLDCNDIAVAGGTGGAIPASNQAELVAAMAEVIAESIRTERCNGVDDDCDAQVDEDFPDKGTACTNGLLGQCRCSGTKQCAADQSGTVCSYAAASASNPCGQPAYGYGAEATFGCDGLDNDCDGLVDEGLSCGTPPPDLCNGLDDDGDPGTADGANDPAVGQPCGSAIGECALGVTACVAGDIVCTGGTGPGAETCNGYDDDCDGVVDGLTRTCYTFGDGNGCDWDAGNQSWICSGQCTAGIQACPALPAENPANTWGACLGERGPAQEVCDGVDNNCDGQVDEGLTQACYPPGSGPGTGCTYSGGVWTCTGECQAGTRTCTAGVWGQCVGYVTPTVEVCDGADNDCNGTPDDDIPGLGQACSNALGRCTPGTLTCVNGVETCEGGAGPFPGECNGLDDDCDGAIDEPDEVSALEGQPCGDATGLCEPGLTVCLGGSLMCQGGVQPATEVCDGQDNDCDGVVDDDAECPPEWYCVAASCRPVCDPTEEFPCPGGLSCQEYEVDGENHWICLPMQGLCGGEVCPDGWVCEEDSCVDPCATVTCQGWEECRLGLCVDVSCTGVGGTCPDTQLCNPVTHQCEDDPCALCTASQTCVNGQCVDDPCTAAGCDPVWEFCRITCDGSDCSGACDDICVCGAGEVCTSTGGCEVSACAEGCPSGSICSAGECVADPCALTTCAPHQRCVDGTCLADPCEQVVCPAHARCQASGDGAGGASALCVPRPGSWVTDTQGEPVTAQGGGLSCATGGGPGGASLLLVLLVGWAAIRRRRRPAGAALGLALVVGLVAAGCDVPTYTPGGNGHWEYLDGGTDAGPGIDARTDAAPDACVPTTEVCNGLDDDCDGEPDNGFDLTADPNNCGACGVVCEYDNAIGACVLTAGDTLGHCEMQGCFPGFHDNNDDPDDGCEYACQETSGGVEYCDGLDNDCDGVVDNGFDLQQDPDNCGQCGYACVFFHGTGGCDGGNCVLSGCEGGYVDKDLNPNNGCECMITDVVDLCDGVDSDCDGDIDEDAPSTGDCYTQPTGCTEPTPGVFTCTGACHVGSMSCAGGFMQCVAEQGPTGEVCNYADDDCNGVVDDGFDLQTDLANCGACGHSCFSAAPAGAYTTGCVGGTCQFACLPGYYDLNGDRNNPAGNGCEYACTPTAPAGTEFCDGVDNDCDGQVDEAGDLGSPPAGLCKQRAGSPCNNVSALCLNGVLGKTWYCQYPAGVETDAANPNLVLANETSCDGVDGNCDGNVDEAFAPLVGTACDDGLLGQCRGTGSYQCNAAHTGTQCVITAPGQAPAAELCDAIDNDCDGLVDESFVNPGTNASYVQDQLVTVSVGGQSVRVYRYEASRPTATAGSEGTGTQVRACSRASVMPWTKVTYEQARLACQAAGMDLCSGTEWKEACDGSGSTWAYPYNATTYNAAACNGRDAAQNAPRATGSYASCVSNGYQIADLSGNLREWTKALVSYTDAGKAIYQVRGGGYTDLSGGLRCDFTSSGLVEDAASANVGFRCCTRCGNNVLDAGEQCDDGNLVNGDGCSAACGRETCGNGVVDAGEECDCGTNPGNLPAGCLDVNGGSHGNCALNCTRPAERCSSIYPEDNDAGGEANDCADPACASTWCADVADNDGDGFTEDEGDCDDNNAAINPAAEEICGNGIDDNCNGFIDNAEPDKDGDGILRCVGGVIADCDDWDARRYPGNLEICGDGVDNNCDGSDAASCATACQIAAQQRSNRGCEFWAASTLNSMLSATFNNNFALVAYNPNASQTTVTVVKNGATVASATVAAGALRVFSLSFDLALKNTKDAVANVTGGAFQVTSTLPISLYQFNPFDYAIGATYSYSNDASLVLPKHALTKDYMITTKPTFWNSSPGFFTVIGTENNTTVQVTFSANVDGGPNAGSTNSYTINAGQVLQFPSRDCAAGANAFCDATYDFTGTRVHVTSGGPVAVFGGHDCLYLPAAYCCCDHIEEQMPPMETWGTRFVVPYTAYKTTNQYRVLSATNGNVVTFNPATVHAQVTLNAGQYVDVDNTSVDFTITCSAGCLVNQFMLSQDYFGSDSDPSMGLLVPTQQFRKDYSFLVPSSYVSNYLTVIKPVGIGAPTVSLDGVAIPEASFGTAVGDSFYGVARINISASPYQHNITSTQPFGIMVYGYAPYTTYLYPGGLDLNPINTVN